MTTETLTQDLTTKAAALATFLGISTDEVSHEYDNTFAVNQREEPQGTSPEDIAKRCELVRRGLALVFPDIKDFTSSTFGNAYLLEQGYNKELEDLQKKIDKRVKELTSIRFVSGSSDLAEANELLSYITRNKQKQEIKDLFERANLNIKPWLRFGGLGSNDLSNDELKAIMKVRRQDNDPQLNQLRQRREELKAERAGLPTYQRIESKLRLLAKEAPQYVQKGSKFYHDPAKPNETIKAEAWGILHEGLHDFLNTLYYISPECTKYGAKDVKHAALVRDIFDGKEVEDPRDISEVDDGEYMVLTDEEADEAATEWIKESVWAFYPHFLAEQTDYDEETFTPLSELCENGNKPILSIIKKTCGLDAFVEAAIEAEKTGRGHFLASYDLEENEVEYEGTTYYIYRTN